MGVERSFLLENLTCPHCAAVIEKKAGAIEGVSEASVDIVTKKLILNHDTAVQPEKIKSAVESIVKSVEPDVRVVEALSSEPREAEEHGFFSSELVRLIAGAVIYAIGVIVLAFHINNIAIAIFILSLAVSGGEVMLKAVKNIVKGQVFDENLLMSIASIGAFAIGQFEEGAAVMLFNQVGEYFQDLAAERSRKSIAQLMNLRPDYANLKTEKGTVKVSPEEVKIGGLIEIRPGERVPLDGAIMEGRSFVDTSGITGEPVPREVTAGDSVTGGFINKDGLLTVKVQKAYGDSTIARVIELVEKAGSKKAKAENFITKFARVYTPVVTAAALLVALIPPLLFSQPFNVWIYRALIFLVVSCPCALVVSVPLGFFAGIGAASRNGVLVKGGNYLEKLAKVDTVVFDKTGTLTKGVFEVVKTVCAKGVSEAELLSSAALAESQSVHPIAKSILKAYGGTINSKSIKNYSESAGMGVAAETANGKIFAGSERLMEREHILFTACDEDGTLVYVALNGRYLGCIVIADIIKDDSKAAISGLHALGVKKTVMLTGDRERAARSVAAAAGVDDVCAQLLPDQKVYEFEKIASHSTGATAFVGDGINDAPVLARADVGIAMGGLGSDAAVEAADIVVMDDKPSRIVIAVRIARYVKTIVGQNIVFSLGVKFVVLILGTLGFANIWAAVFADTGVALIAVLNSLRILIGTERFRKGA